ncbi:unnamed protein product [Diplocarpon coronariae]
MALGFNRRNVNRAITDNMPPELGMDTNDFNYGQTIFLAPILAAELPSRPVSKKVGPERSSYPRSSQHPEPVLARPWSPKHSRQRWLSQRASEPPRVVLDSPELLSTNIYREDDMRLYVRGNEILLSICSFNILLFHLVKYYDIWHNAKRDVVWNAMSVQEQENYVATTKDEGAKRLNFRFAH